MKIWGAVVYSRKREEKTWGSKVGKGLVYWKNTCLTWLGSCWPLWFHLPSISVSLGVSVTQLILMFKPILKPLTGCLIMLRWLLLPLKFQFLEISDFSSLSPRAWHIIRLRKCFLANEIIHLQWFVNQKVYNLVKNKYQKCFINVIKCDILNDSYKDKNEKYK